MTSGSLRTAKVGSIVATADEDEAYYGRVTALDGNTAVTQPVTLADIFPTANFGFDGAVGEPTAARAATASGTAPMTPMALGGRLRNTCRDPLGAEAEIFVTPVLESGRFEIDADWSLIDGIKRLRVVYAPRLALTVETSVAAKFDCTATFGLFGIHLPPIEFFVGATPPIPVKITQKLSGKLEFGLHLEAKATAKVAVSTGLDFGFDCVGSNCSSLSQKVVTWFRWLFAASQDGFSPLTWAKPRK